MPNDEHYSLMAMEQLQQDINNGDWTDIYESLQRLPEDTLTQYVTFEEPSYD